MPAKPSGNRRRASIRPVSSSISMSWWASAQSSPTNSTAPPSSGSDQQGTNRGEDLLQPNGSVLNGTTSHQHYRPPHQPPGHDLVIDLNGPGKTRVLTGSGLGQHNASTRRCCTPIRLAGLARNAEAAGE